MKTIEQAIRETESKLIEIIEESHLSAGILELILRNIHAQVKTIAMSQTEVTDEQSESDTKPDT